MNVSFTFKSLLISLYLIIPLVGFSQLEYHCVIANEGFETTILSSPNGPTVTSLHGTVTKTYIGSTEWQLNYTPDPGFIGLDTLDVGYWQFFQPARRGIVLNVVPSKVSAENDYASTTTDQLVVIDVLSNDYSSRDNLILSGIPIVSNGNAVPDGNNIVFIPEAGFEGLAHFNYIVCDDIGTCATGTVSVSVIGTSTPAPFDTTYLATAKNTTLPIPLNYDNFTVFNAPSFGSAAFIAPNVIEYDPATDHVGIDEFTLKRVQNGISYYQTFIIDVLTSQNPNGVAFDDYAYTPVNTPVETNVSDNDLGNYNVISFTQSNHGLVEKLSGKVMRFTPDLGFSGVATYTYKINVGSHTETATVFVTVDNQTPSSSVFNLSTIKNVPKPIYYDAPISEFSFSIVSQADHGTVDIYPGFLDTLIYGQPIVGNNLVIYTPDIDFVGIDEFEVLYCVTANNQCQLTKVVMEVVDLGIPTSEICISDDCVWPGDGNNDGVVNMVDLLFLGYSFGDIGAARSNPSLQWYGQFAAEWNKSAFPGSADSKFTDMNGDGVISDSDLPAMDACYNLTHSLTPEYNPFAKNYPYYLIPSDTLVNAAGDGHFVTFDIILGNSNSPIIDFTGFTFSFDFNPLFVEQNSIQVTFDNNSWFNFNSPTMELTKAPWLGRTDVGYTRTNGYGVSGYGKVGTLELLSFIVDDNIDGFRTDDIKNIINMSVLGMDGQGNYIKLPDASFEVPTFVEDKEPLSNDDLTLYPNPTTGQFKMTLESGTTNEIKYYQIYSITGKALYNSGNISNIAAQSDMSNLTDGIYIVRVQTSKGVITKKVQILK